MLAAPAARAEAAPYTLCSLTLHTSATSRLPATLGFSTHVCFTFIAFNPLWSMTSKAKSESCEDCAFRKIRADGRCITVPEITLILEFYRRIEDVPQL